MRILYGQGYTEIERKVMISVIHANLINMVKTLILMTEELGGFNNINNPTSNVPITNRDSTESTATTNPTSHNENTNESSSSSSSSSSTSNDTQSNESSSSSSSTTVPSSPSVSSASLQEAIQVIKKLSDDTTLNPTYGNYVQLIWNHPAVQEAYKSRSKFQLSDGASYFLNRVEEICKVDYIPSVDDVLHTRVRTSGILAEEYIIDDVSFCIYDVGGQRNERRKWIHAFDDVTAIIFVAAISECKYILLHLYISCRQYLYFMMYIFNRLWLFLSLYIFSFIYYYYS